ncbi:hypothetical protein N481_07870 [Pseudoalteromonas luteoviolacea S4047-1]|uniref:Lipoprotein n=1 Tax=Pseudoalteromonas luteoviolacea S4054 TaxID=1129367 RepID=A0A0F6A9P3_9GAMM|nr:hypothetical protein N479_16615 [Pseudoalteromonas luteoviolacea S4054]KZN75224.1 hypothetical protein N481_07870 [Pseudoalteromonas luteoviolacea S4047-1]
MKVAQEMRKMLMMLIIYSCTVGGCFGFTG